MGRLVATTQPRYTYCDCFDSFDLKGWVGGEVEVPRSVLTALARVLDSFAHGEGVTLVPTHAELTTQQAADALNVSRPFLIRLLDAGQIAYRTVGTHRRIKAASLVRYLREDDARRVAVADELAAEARDGHRL